MIELIHLREHRPSKSYHFKEIDLDFITSTLQKRVNLIRESNGLYSLQATKYVGAVKLPSGEFVISITPKINSLNFFQMLDFSKLSSIKFHETYLEASPGKTLVDLLADIFIKNTNEIIATGLYRNYITNTEELSSIKGKLLIIKNIRSTKFVKAKPWCEYDELSFDIIENRCILFCTQILLSVVYDSEIKRKLITIRNLLLRQGVELTPLEPFKIDSIVLQRLNKKYEEVIKLCKFILHRRWYDNFLDQKVPIPAFFINMNDLFEKFVYEVLRLEYEKKGYSVEYQEKNPHLLRKIPDYAPDENRLSDPPDIKPDIIIRGKNKKLIIDTKYKFIPDSSDFYQAAAYSLVHNCNSVLLLPEEDQELSDGYEIQNKGIPISENNRIHVKTIKLEDSEDFIENTKRRILDIINPFL